MPPKTLKRRFVKGKVVGGVVGVTDLYSRLLLGRGVQHKSEVEHSLKHLLPPDSLKGLPEAVALLLEAIDAQGRILIVGDFDADGATSTVLLLQGLRAMGAASVDYLVPNRFEFGYGLSPEIVDVARSKNPDLIVTVDNGISSVAGVKYARDSNIKVLITDHHLPPDELPCANAIVNPNQDGCDFPSKNLAGVGVAFYLLLGLRKALRDRKHFETRAEPNLAVYLDLLALGTIADVVTLDYNNRILVQEGLRRMRLGKLRPGIKSLLAIAGKNLSVLSSTDLAFGVAPRLNAAGRLDDISLGIECLLSDDENEAQRLAEQLDELNLARREIENDMKQEAVSSLAELKLTDKPGVGICLFQEGWHQGVVGIVASRIKDKLHRPVIAFAKVSDVELKGSARSISGLHIRDALDAIAAKNPGLLVKFGGHAMAAGLSLHPDNYTRFERAFDEEAAQRLSEDDLEDILLSDGGYSDYDVVSIRSLMLAYPWGQGFPEPLFDDEFEIVEQRIVAAKHLKLKLRPIESDQVLDAIAFNNDRLVEGRHRRIAYRLDVNEYRGRESVQLIVDSLDLKH